MAPRTALILLLVASSLLALRYHDAIGQTLFADTEANVPVKLLNDRTRVPLMAGQTALCLRHMAGDKPYVMATPEVDSFCGCKIGGLSLILTKREFARGEFDNIQRFVDHSLQVREIAARCAREAAVSL